MTPLPRPFARSLMLTAVLTGLLLVPALPQPLMAQAASEPLRESPATKSRGDILKPAPLEKSTPLATQEVSPGSEEDDRDPARIRRPETVVAGVSRDSIAITTNFTGSDLLIFGAVRRESPIPKGKLGVIISVEGPEVPVTVRRKARVAGIWVNTSSVTVEDAPTFYAVASSAPLDELLSPDSDLSYRISIPRAIGAYRIGGGDGPDEGTLPDFAEALMRIREHDGFYLSEDNAVEIAENTLFRARFLMPANLREGNYTVRIFLTRNGQVIDANATELDVRKAGLERWLYALSKQQPWIYGIMALLLAALAGWGASAVFTYIRR